MNLVAASGSLFEMAAACCTNVPVGCVIPIRKKLIVVVVA
jgi:hypothetical protein